MSPPRDETGKVAGEFLGEVIRRWRQRGQPLAGTPVIETVAVGTETGENSSRTETLSADFDATVSRHRARMASAAEQSGIE